VAQQLFLAVHAHKLAQVAIRLMQDKVTVGHV